MIDTDKKFVSILLDVLEEKGVRDVVCSPGSRNAPLLIGVGARKSFRKHFVVDERSAAFQALGIALVSRKPVILICTSGTALLNYSPAIAEAYYQGVPLIVISADRPIQWIDQDDSQTLRQNEAMANFVKQSYTIPASGEENGELQWYVNRIVNDAFLSACSGKQGPVHINIALSEPLGRKIHSTPKKQRLVDLIEADSLGNKERIKELAKELSQSKVLLVAGFMNPDAGLQKAVASFSQFANVAVMAETLSNLHLDIENYSVDSTLTSLDDNQLESLRPDIVISIGGALVSRKLKEYLRAGADTMRHWSLGFSHTTTDPFMSLSLRLELDPARFLRNVSAVMKKTGIGHNVSRFKYKWHELRMKALMAKKEFIKEIPWCELRAFSEILGKLPGNYNLFLSNGTAVRYAQIVNHGLPHGNYCNRGVSGIDGSISTAIGGALTYKNPTLIITGDLSMTYDIGSLSCKEIPDNFKIIVMDNQGGGIFRFIPSTSTLDEREEFFCMPPNLPLRQLAEAYQWKFFEADNQNALDHNLTKFFTCHGKAIMRIACDGEKSAEILKNYMNVKL